MEKEMKTNLTLLGETYVGKSSICQMFLGFGSNSIALASIGMAKFENKMKMFDGNEIKITLWDTAGQERFRSKDLTTLRFAKGAIVVFDVTSKNSFVGVDSWLKSIKEYSEDIPVVLFWNKCDLNDKREVRKEEIQQYADENGIIYFETSTKENIGVKEGFETICEMVYKKIKKNKMF